MRPSCCRHGDVFMTPAGAVALVEQFPVHTRLYGAICRIWVCPALVLCFTLMIRKVLCVILCCNDLLVAIWAFKGWKWHMMYEITSSCLQWFSEILSHVYIFPVQTLCCLLPRVWIDDAGRQFLLELVSVLSVLDELLPFPREKVWATSLLIWMTVYW